MDKIGQNNLGQLFLIVVVFVLGGTGLSILYNTQGDIGSIIGGFSLVGVAVAIIYRLINR